MTTVQVSLFLEQFERVEIQVHQPGVQSHNSLGNGERYHADFRNVYKKIRDDVDNMPKDDALKLAVKAVKDTAVPAGLVRTILVFGVLPSLPINPKY